MLDEGVPRLLRRLRATRAVWAARLDYYARPSLRFQYGGAFNGQLHRQRLFLELLARGSLRAIVETGAYRGTTAEFMALASGLPTRTVERNPRYSEYTRLRLGHLAQARAETGDSITFLERLSTEAGFPNEDVFFYLDAHDGSSLPLLDELRVISSRWHNSVIMIDDFQVPGDEGYGFNTWCGRPLAIAYIRDVLASHHRVFFPSVASMAETGHRRGCVVLTSGTWVERAQNTGLLTEQPWR